MDRFPRAWPMARRGEARSRMLSTSLRKDGDVGHRRETITQSRCRMTQKCIFEQQQKIIIRIGRGIFKYVKRNTKSQGWRVHYSSVHINQPFSLASRLAASFAPATRSRNCSLAMKPPLLFP